MPTSLLNISLQTKPYKTRIAKKEKVWLDREKARSPKK